MCPAVIFDVMYQSYPQGISQSTILCPYRLNWSLDEEASLATTFVAKANDVEPAIIPGKCFEGMGV